MEEGVIKFTLQFTEAGPVNMQALAELNRWRTILWQQALIGQDPARYEGYGFGNVSQRTGADNAARGKRSFIISGTQTGHLPKLDNTHYTLVRTYDAASNSVNAAGPIKPSSESLTHGMIYDLDDEIRVVLHVHSPDIWLAADSLGIPVTDNAVPYGTPMMSAEVQRLFNETDVRKQKIFSMGGHEDGIVSFGTTAEEAGDILLRTLDASRKH
ncbi:MAG: class II aldolase/adducin family protein [Gammaproteobacteria bacterium]|jgi:ribulose-5-phosphate 4-epimerase/fuculose-1-phosphate aldolase